MGEIWDEIIKDVDDNKWCTICFPVDSKQITSKCLNALFSILAKDVSTTLSHTCLEIQFCMLEPDECLKASLHGICERYLKETYIEIDLQIHGCDHSQEPEKKGKYTILYTIVLKESKNYMTTFTNLPYLYPIIN